MAATKAPTVSVIMPVYNVDRYLLRAIESLQRQTFKDFELIIVDDGSTDRSGDIADKCAERDIRIEVIHVENRGAAVARNLALTRARGTYVQFMDADDWEEPEMLADMVALMQEHNLELGISGFFIDTYYGDKGEHLSEIKTVPSVVYTSAQEFRKHAFKMFDQNLFYSPWNKLFLRSRIEELGIRFRDTFMDDFPFVLDYIRDVERVGMLEKAYYHFIRQRSESETSKWRPNLYEKREDEHSWMLDLYHHWGLDADPSSLEMIQRRYIERLVGCIEGVCDPSCTLSTKEKLRFIDKIISTDHAQLAVAVARPRSQMMRIMLAPIKRKNARLTYAEGCFISMVRRRNTKLFATLKANR